MDLIIRNNKAHWGDHVFECSLGKRGIVDSKVEGDMGTPVGQFPFRKLYYRPDRLPVPETSLPLHALAQDDGWCDDPEDPHYNCPIKHPYPTSHEKLWRDDHVYDLILVIGQNDDPVIPGKGSAVFIHLRQPEGTPTAGCVAFSLENLLHILKECSTNTFLIVESAHDS